MFCGHDLFDLGDDLGVLFGDIVLLHRVVGQIVQLNRRHARLLAANEMMSNGFPVAHANGLLAAVAVELPVEPGVFLLEVVLTQQGRDKADSVGVVGRLSARDFGQCRHDVPEG